MTAYYASPLNRAPEVRREMDLPPAVQINDVTLREGEQGFDVVLSVDEKVALARRLAEMGVRQIEVGWPGRSAEDREVIGRIRDAGVAVVIQSPVQIYAADWRAQVDAAVGCGVGVVALLHPVSDMRLERLERTTRAAVVRLVREAVAYAKAQGAQVAMCPTDATRADLRFLAEVAAAAVEVGADRVVLPDTVGAALPAAVRRMVKTVRLAVSVPVHIHCHDDYGLALANTLAGIEAGASLADASVNGLGERAGNCALDELAVALEVLYGIPTGIQLPALTALCREVAARVGVPLSPHKALVGEMAFAHRLDVHLEGLRVHPPLFETIAPEAVGNARRVVLGPRAGPALVEARLRELGLTVERAKLPGLVARVRDEARARGGPLDDETLRRLAEVS